MTARYEVVGAAVVLRLVGGGERYLYRGATVEGPAFTEESVGHAAAVGLLRPVGDEQALSSERAQAAETAGQKRGRSAR